MGHWVPLNIYDIWDKMRIRLRRLMQLEMERLHFFRAGALPIYPLLTTIAPPPLRSNHPLFTFILLTGCSSQVDFTSCGGFLSIASILLLIIGIVTAIVLSFQYVSAPWSGSVPTFCHWLTDFKFWGLFVCNSTGPLATYALCQHRSRRLHSGGFTLTGLRNSVVGHFFLTLYFQCIWITLSRLLL